MSAIGYQLAHLRRQKGMTQAGLSERSGIPQPNLSKIESGTQDPTVSTFLRICSSLDVPPASVFEKRPTVRKPIVWTRDVLERVAHAAVGFSKPLKKGEREVVELLKDVTPGLRRRLASRRVYHSWFELKQSLSQEEIHTLFERIRDARQRLK